MRKWYRKHSDGDWVQSFSDVFSGNGDWFDYIVVVLMVIGIILLIRRVMNSRK